MTTHDPPPFGPLVRRLRTAAALSQEELAERAGLSVRGLGDLERGVHQAPRLETVRLLADALALGAGERTALLAAARPDIAAAPPAVPEGRAALTALPLPPTRLIGRERELAALCSLLAQDEHRLVTLTGPGGSGKTRLALAIARAMRDRFDDGIGFVDFSPLTEATLVLPTIAAALGLREASHGLADRLAGFFGEKRVLLVLDNCERVVEAAPDIAALLARAPGLQVLATSRTPLHAYGERECPLAPLPAPDPAHLPAIDQLSEFGAIRLFVERAQAVQPDFLLTDANAPAVAAICHRLDGLPLAIELAAARVRILPPLALLTRLERRLPLLTGGARTLPARQRTMRDAIAWSHDLLAPEAQALFRRLSVFAGGFTLEAAEWVMGDGSWVMGRRQEPTAITPSPITHDPSPSVLDGVASLVAMSLLQPAAGPDGAPRFRMLETIREFGLERLVAADETEATMRRLAEWCRALLDGVKEAFFTAAQGHWVERLEDEHDNLRTVLAWAIEQGDAETALHLTEDMGFFWIPRGYLGEGRTWGERALALADAMPTAERASTLVGTATIAWLQGDNARARELATAGFHLARQVDNVTFEGTSQLVLGWTAEDEGRFDEAAAHLGAALRHFQAHGIATWAGFTLNYLGHVDYARGDLAAAAAHFAEAGEIFRATGNTYGLGFVLTNQAKAARGRGDYARATALYAESLVLRHEQGDKYSIAGGLRGLALVAAQTRRYERAARLWGAAEALGEAVGAAPPRHPERAQDAIATTRNGLGEEGFAAAWAAGRALSLAEAVAEALRDAAIPGTPAVAPTLASQYGLTAREEVVLRLLQGGLTNRQIGDELFISERTAGTHVHNILSKLDVSNRTEAVALAKDHGLI